MLAEVRPKSIALVVDDNPDSIGMVSSALEQNNMTVLIARDGRSAIDLTRRVEPDVILMDAVMPEMDGFDACRALKLGANPILAPIIFMTGLTEQEHILKGLAAGGVDYVTKPIVVEELIARLGIHVVNSQLLRSARAALDSSDRAVLAFDRAGNLSWGSERALEHISTPIGQPISAQMTQWLLTCQSQPISSTQPITQGNVSFQYVGETGVSEIVVKVLKRRTESNEDLLSAAFDLTAREAEVLFWLTLGKTNRDISAILGLSARTVNKHLEQVFQKMGVDNRTSAAVLADRLLNSEQ